MFDIGWSEMAVIALIALIVIGPKDLPRTMKTIAQWMRKARSLTREFQSGIDEMVREAELEDARKALDATRRGNLERTISNAVDPDDEVAGEVKGIEREARREASSDDTSSRDKGDSNAERAAATFVSQPASIAPAHSLQPPSEKASADKPADKPAEEPAAAGEPQAQPSGTTAAGSKQSA